MGHDVKKAYEDHFIQLHNSDLIYLMKTCKPTTINVFLALHIRANRKVGNTCFPSLSTIADDANVSRRTVVNAIEELESVGLVTVEKRMDDAGDQTSNLYWLHRRSKPAQGSAESTPQVVQDLHQGVVQNLHPNHMNSFNTDKIELNSSGDEGTNDGAKTPAVEEKPIDLQIMDAFCEETGLAKFASFATARKQAQQLAKADFTPDEVRELIKWLRSQEWITSGISLGLCLNQADQFRTARTNHKSVAQGGGQVVRKADTEASQKAWDDIMRPYYESIHED